ncbi:alanine racemase [Salininema proteolyticum]|uniref:Alanine racemase n=1 Tax=Salininema proteolyticum TaxID=1607685 RepID=A0ABV8TV26_9ACTN
MDSTVLPAPQRDWDDPVLDADYHTVPFSAWGRRLSDWLAERPSEASLPTPVVVGDAAALDSNVKSMAEWCAARGIELSPHGKSTMAPRLWRRQLEAGAAGVTVANAAQARVAVLAGVGEILIANEVTDPEAVAWLSAVSEAGARVSVFADSLDGVALLDRHCRGGLRVYTELGVAGGRGGARSLEEARAVAEAVRRSANLTLAGTAGYEGAVTGRTDPESLAAVDAYLSDLAELHRGLDHEADDAAITVGGSAFYDRVAAVLAGRGERILLRAGAYAVHDHGFYRRIAPFERGGDGPVLKPVCTARVRVLSLPEPGVAVLDAGRRDLPFDQDLPRPLHFDHASAAIADQHLTLTGVQADLAVGDTVELGLSHPCTIFDKWRLVPLVEDGTVVDALPTFF